MDKSKKIKIGVLLLVIAACVAMGWLIAPFPGLDATGMRFLAIFVLWIALMIIGVTELHISTLIACVLCVLVGLPDAGKLVWSQFGSPTVMLMLGAFGMAIALANSGLLRRVALLVVRIAPKSGIGQLLSFELASTAITPWIPAAVGKLAVLVPIGEQIAGQLGYKPHSRAYTSFFLIPLVFSIPVGLCFLTGHATVGSAMAFIPYEMSWLGWLQGTLPYLVSFIVLLTVFLVFYFKSGTKGQKEQLNPEALTASVNEQLAQMGKMSGREIYSLIVLVIVIGLFLCGGMVGIPAYITALLAWLSLSVGGLFGAKDLAKVNWPILLFMGGALGLIAMLSATGVDVWIAALCSPIIEPLVAQPVLFVVVLTLLVYVLRFAMVGPTTIMALALAILASSGIDAFVFCFVIIESSMVWFLYYMNITVVGALGLTDGRVVQKDLTVSSIAFAVINLVCLLISVPFWAGMGLL